MFKNRWGALIFVCLSVLGAVSLIGGEDDHGALLLAADELTETKSELQIQAGELSQADSSAEPTPDEQPVSGFMSDEELIDDTRGIDPAPDIDPSPAAENVEEQGDVIMYIEDD
ncbi:hypothetical protein [Allopontixanthobacter sp.]|uniref:hypothetical protein n=1 Tax=Allopontixanthobacter sp. TaxID=2906452 RepID=UPI002ABB04FB|nr:hypothetical protein [Allopontixanthobacter sp.]MDZ4308835.1 hypothetical protein [Allopontixanthobacter sp.]